MPKEKEIMKKQPDQNNIKPNHHEDGQHSSRIPEIEIIDLDQTDEDMLFDHTDAPQSNPPENGGGENGQPENGGVSGEKSPARPKTGQGKGKSPDMHTVMHLSLLGTVLIVVLVVGFCITHLGTFVSQEEIFKDGLGEVKPEIYDYISLGPSVSDQADETDSELNILMFGNAPLSDDRDSENGLANLIAQGSGANVINCSVSGSYAAVHSAEYLEQEYPMDAFSPYWLTALTLESRVSSMYDRAKAALGDNCPAETDLIVDTLTHLDMDTVDVVVFMYDASDYLLGNGMSNSENPTDICTFAGSLSAAIELFQVNYPHIRVIVMSPAYAYAVDENGEYVSSDSVTYGQGYLSTYFHLLYAVCVGRGVTFVDNLYGTITEENAKEYLVDNIHLNDQGRSLMTDRFIYAMSFYSH